MNKTIEEAARKQIHELSLAFTKELHDDETIPYHTCRDSLMWLFARPLSDRLTAEEKERVRKEYGELLCYASIHKRKLANSTDAGHTRFNSQNYQFYVAQIKLLKRIFGADFFKEEE